MYDDNDWIAFNHFRVKEPAWVGNVGTVWKLLFQTTTRIIWEFDLWMQNLHCRYFHWIKKKNNLKRKTISWINIYIVKIAAIWTLFPDKQKLFLNSFSLKLLKVQQCWKLHYQKMRMKGWQKCEKRNRNEITITTFRWKYTKKRTWGKNVKREIG